MPTRVTHLHRPATDDRLTEALAALRTEHEVPTEFPEAVLAEAEAATPPEPGLDLTEIPFVTLDPAPSKDLDQAFHLERSGSGYTVRYAIADIAGFVTPGGALDTEARSRGQTLYLPDGSVPLHPRILSEDRASLVAGTPRSAYVWTMEVDAAGIVGEYRVERAMIRSRAKLDYESAQADINRGVGDGPLALLPEIGRLRVARERDRGGASLTMPDEEIVRANGTYDIVLRDPLEVEEWNAQLSLLTGMCAGRMMRDAGVGILRTMPRPDAEQLARFRSRVADLGTPWSEEISYGDYLRRLDRTAPYAPAVLHAATSLFRGAGYTVLDAASRDLAPEALEQAAIASPYAHVTAPIRRLVDRWGLVVCEALSAGREVPGWVHESIGDLPGLMQASGSRAGQLGAAALDRVEAALLTDRPGETFEAIVLEARETSARVQVADPPVTATCDALGLVSGERIHVRVTHTDIAQGTVELALART